MGYTFRRMDLSPYGQRINSKKKRANREVRPDSLARIRRSGRFPALPYPPVRLKDVIADEDGFGNGTNLFGAKEERDFVIAFFDADELAGDAAAGEEAEAVPVDFAALGDLAKDGTRRVLDGRKQAGARARAGEPAGQRRLIPERFVWANDVINLSAPELAIGVKMIQGVSTDGGPQFAFESGVEWFDFA